MTETAIQETEVSREKLFTVLYKEAFPHVARYVSKMGGTLQDAKDVFHDALIIFYEKHLHERENRISTDEAYLLGISKHLWSRKFKKDHTYISLQDDEYDIDSADESNVNISEAHLLNILMLTGKKCLDLLQAFYYEKLQLKEIAKTFGYSSERSATVQKHKCIEKVRNKVKENSIAYDDFTE